VAGIGITLLKVSDEFPHRLFGSRVCCWWCCWLVAVAVSLGRDRGSACPAPSLTGLIAPHHDYYYSHLLPSWALCFTSFVSALLAACDPFLPR